jgi:undecaprenyl-diphosphatase
VLRERIAGTLDSLPLIGASFLLTGTLLVMASRVPDARRPPEALGIGDALVIGLFQVAALLPGVSRSGTTIAGGLFLRLKPDVAARFSFLLAIPVIAGAILVELPNMLELPPEMRGPLMAGIVTSAATGLLAIALLLRLVRGGKLNWFGYYCWALGTLVLVASTLGGVA